jgi:MFS transporter, PAT family, beta-lactamase induction signal transducer AmpG
MKIIDISRASRRQRFGLLGVLYLAQGIPFGLFMQALPVILRERGVSLEAIGFSALLALPWALKFLWAPFVDRRPPGPFSWPRRKGWLVPIQLLTAGVFSALALLGLYDSLAWLLAAVFVVNLLNATQDIATDGLAVDMLAVEERGAGNALQVGGYRVGMIAGGAGVLVLIEAAGWRLGLSVCAGLLLLALLPLLAFREDLDADSPAGQDRPDESYLASFRGFFERPWAVYVFAIAVIFKFGEAFGAGMLRPLLVDRGYTMGDIGWMLGGVGFAFGLLGAVGGGLIGDRLCRQRALLVAVVVQICGVALFVPLAWGAPSVAKVSTLVAMEHFASGVATVILFACMMDWARPSHSGADYTLLASAVVISTGVAQALSGVSAQHFGYVAHFLIAAALTLLGGLFALRLYARAGVDGANNAPLTEV